MEENKSTSLRPNHTFSTLLPYVKKKKKEATYLSVMRCCRIK